MAIKFKDPFSELEKPGFPGITDPKITIESKFKEKTAFEHDSAVQYALKDDDTSLRLPEKYNGLGYQNLISITFKLMSFRDGTLVELYFLMKNIYPLIEAKRSNNNFSVMKYYESIQLIKV